MGNLLNIGNSKGIKYELDKEVFTGDSWVDGKPIYRKVVKATNNKIINNNVQIPCEIQNLNEMIDYNVVIYKVDNNITAKFAYGKLTVKFQNNNIVFYGNGEWTPSEYDYLYIRLYYTKSGGVINRLLSFVNPTRKWGVCCE